MENLTRILEDCERSIDLDHLKQNEIDLKKCLKFENNQKVCMRVNPPQNKYPWFTVQETHDDVKKMMFNELASFAGRLELKDSNIPMIRANYGVGIIPSLFGLNCRIVGNNMPWVDHVEPDEVKKIIKNGVPDYRNGYGAKVIETYEFYREMLSKYPKCNQAIRLYCPDHQGPFDIAHLIYGSDIYLDLYEDPDFVHELLSLVTETYIDTVKHIKPYLNDETDDGFCYQWGHIFPGKILLRNDSAVNLSPDMYLEFVKPYDDRVMQELGYASMHYCGRADQWIHNMATSEGIVGYNFGHVPNIKYGTEFLDFVKRSLTDKRKPIIAYVLESNEVAEFDFANRHTGITYETSAKDIEDAKRILDFCNSSVR